ncbi:hypothetical protein SESBI_29042 [Sesbania bispinosa]|nr:hypothetical protein SESBI_29042 [Sesbania bispinosa]
MGHPSSTLVQSTTKDDVAEERPKKGYWRRKFIEQVGSWMAHKDKDEWLECASLSLASHSLT